MKMTLDFTKQLMASQQERLADLRYYTGKIDGDGGPLTKLAFVDFKSAHSMLARDYPGPLTMKTLWSGGAKPREVAKDRVGDTPNLTEARRLMGVSEVPGVGNNPTIMGWAKDLDQWYPGDDVPWCGLFVAHCQKVGFPNEPQNFNRLGARAWEAYGQNLGKMDIPPLGSVCRLWRTHLTKSWNGHVFIVTGYSREAVRGIGGNQSDTTSELWFPKDRVLGYNVPNGLDWKPAPLAKTGEFSKNEA